MTSLESREPTFLDAEAGDELPRAPIFLEIGRSGLRRVSGYVDDEFLPQLKGRKGVKVFREMGDNSSVLGGWAYGVRHLLRQIEWRVEPAENQDKYRADAEFVEQCMEDMESSWGETVFEIANFIIYGWSLHELCYKKRLGPWYQNEENKNLHRSRFNDSRIGWSKIPGRAQETMWRWVFDETGDILGMTQMPPPKYQKIVVPLDRALLFRTTTEKNNPEGRSLLRNAYVAWFFLKRFQEIEATGVARDLAGMPIAKVPLKLAAATSGKELEMRRAIETLVTKVSRNENEGIVWPWEIDETTKQPLYDFELLTSGGSRQFDTNTIIDRYKTEMLQSVLSDFMMVGHEDNGGSYALHTDKSGLFRTALNALAQQIADQFNRQAIPKLFALNAMKPDKLPKIVPNDVDPPALAELGQFMTALVNAGMPLFPDPKLEQFVRDAARLPELDPHIEDIREEEQKQAAVLSLVTQRMQLLQVEQQAQMGADQMAQSRLSTSQQAADAVTQADMLENPQAVQPDPGDPTGAQAQAQAGQKTAQAQQSTAQAGEKTNQAKLATQQQQVRLSQEKQKLANLKRQPAKAAPAKKQPAKKQPAKKQPANRSAR